ncbi:MAG: DUF3545 family protein [Colwellia sp.]|nr:DUF3545 family protein [Colwellia sp.]
MEDIDDVNERGQKSKGKGRKRKWREIEQVKEQRLLRRNLATFEHYSL